jgi:hypothetical protein
MPDSGCTLDNGTSGWSAGPLPMVYDAGSALLAADASNDGGRHGQ